MKICKSLSYSEKIRWRNRLLYLLLLVMLVYMIVIGELHLGDSRIMSGMAETVSRIIFFGGMIWVVRKIICNKRLLKEPVLLREQMTVERDERNQYLHDKSGGLVWDILFVCLLSVTLTASLTNMAAFYTSFVLLCVAILLKLTAYLIYKKLA